MRLKKYHHALWLSLIVNTFVAATDVAGARLHAAGHVQGVLGYLVGAGHILNMPGVTAADALGLRPMHRWTWPGFAVDIVVNFGFWLVVGLVWIRLRRRFEVLTTPPAPAPGPATSEPLTTPNETGARPAQEPLLSRRRLLLGGGRAVAGAGIGVGGWGFFVEGRWFEVTRREVPIKGLSPALDGLRIVHITDLHHGTWMSVEWVRQVIDKANALEPDLVALTGDYVYRGREYVRPVAREIRGLRAACGVVAVMGNHDWWEGGGELTRRVFAEEGIDLIDNARRFVRPDRTLVADAREGLCVAGVGDLWEDKCLYERALGGVPGGVPRVLLSHNPDVAEEPAFLAGGYRCDLILSGHTHGGQIRLPGIGAPVTNSAYGSKYASGLVQGPLCPVFVSRGLGMTVMPVRLGVRPELAVIELRAV
jgi:hypothetical protein